MNTIAVTDRKTHGDSLVRAKAAAERLVIPFVDRKKASLADLRASYGVDNILIAKKGLLYLDTPEGELFFHPNMSQLRVKNLRLGQSDHMVEAMGIKPGMKVLDCTMGFGADSIVASFAAGDNGSVTGVEVSPLIAEVVGYGLSHFLAGNYEMHAALRRIKVVNADYLDFLKRQPDKSFDSIYFDPMFRHPLTDSKNINPLRSVADHRPLSEEAVAEARRVARHRVVMKENARSLEFARLGFDTIMGGKYSKVHYGVIMLD